MQIRSYPHPQTERRGKSTGQSTFLHTFYNVIINLSHFKMEVASPETSKAKVTPKKPSITSSMSYPYLPSEEELETKKPKSGIFINVTEKPDEADDFDSFDLVYERKPRPGYE